MKDHNGHIHDTVNKMAEKHRSQLKEVTTPIEGMIQDLSDVRDNIDKMMMKIRKQGDEVNKQIDQHYDELVRKLMTQKDQMKKQVYDTVSQKEIALMIQLGEVESAKDEVVRMKELNDYLEKGSNFEALSARKQMINGMQKLTERYEKLNKLPVQSTTMEFVRSTDPFPQFSSFISYAECHDSEIIDVPKSIIIGRKVEVTIITKDSSGDHCSIGGHKVFIQLKSSAGNVTVGEVKDNNDGSYMALIVGEQVGETNYLYPLMVRKLLEALIVL